MKKFLYLLFIPLFILCLLHIKVNAADVIVEGEGKAALSGYDINATRSQEDDYMYEKSHKSKSELMHSKQINEATRQANNRKKQDKRMSDTVRGAVVSLARERADKNALKILVERTLGAGTVDNPSVAPRLNDLYSQFNTYVINKVYTGEVIDNNYIARVKLTVDDASFRDLVSDLGLAINTEQVRSHSILIVMDEFFTAPSDMHSNVLTKETTTYDYKYNEKDKEATKYSSKDSASAKAAAGYSGFYGAAGAKASSSYKSSENYGNYVDYSKNESEFFQNIREYAPRNPQAQNINLTRPALASAFGRSDIRTIDEKLFKSKYFKGKPITSDQLQNSEELAKYVKFALTDAKADYFAIGVSYITDRGENESTGMRAADGVVYMEIFSTQDGEMIAAARYEDSALGNTADTARSKVAGKIGTALGEELAKQIQKYYTRRNMYGSEYIVEIRGNLLPIERININKSLQSANNIKNVRLRSSDSTKAEYVLNYSGQEPIGDYIFMQLIDVSPKFNNYDFRLNSNQIIFEQSKGK